MILKDSIIEWLKEQFKQNGGKGAVIGISGGKDSTVVAGLLVEALGKDKVFGVLMPNGTQKDINDSYEVVKYLGIDYTTIDIYEPYEHMLSEFYNARIPITEEAIINIAPRLRMTTLYAIAQSMGYRVVGTGNLCERYIGYMTKGGDALSDLNPIGNLLVSEVLELGYTLNLPRHLVDKTPSDGLCGSSDEDRFGFTYKQLEDYIVKGTSYDNNVNEKIFNMHNVSRHKRVDIPMYEID